MKNETFRKMSGIEDPSALGLFFKEIKEEITKYLVKELEQYRKYRNHIESKNEDMVALYRMFKLFDSVENHQTLGYILCNYGVFEDVLRNVNYIWDRYWRKRDKLLNMLNFDGYRCRGLLSIVFE